MKKFLLLSAFSLFLLMGCNVTGGLVLDSGFYAAPPAHAPAHGRRANHRYHYYPNAEFYFDVARNTYFYLDSNAQWAFSVNLPFHLRHHLHNNYVEIEMDDARPYRRHKHYKNKYRKHKTKYHRKYNKNNNRKYNKNNNRKYNKNNNRKYNKNNNRKYNKKNNREYNEKNKHENERKRGRKQNSLDDSTYKSSEKNKSHKKNHRKYDEEK